MASPPLGNSDHVVVSVSIDFPLNSKRDALTVVSVSIDFPLNSKRDALFHCIAYDFSCADWDGLHDHLRDVP